MIFWGNKPFGRLVIALIIGIVLARYLPIYSNKLYLLFAIIALIFVYSTQLRFRSREYYSGILLILLVIVLGYTRTISIHPEMDYSHYSNYIDDGDYFVSAEVLTIPKKTTRYSCYIQVHAIGNHIDSMKNVTGKMSAYFQLDDNIAQELNPGDEIILNGYVNELRHSRNPHAFDFNDYLKTKHVYHRVDIDNNLCQKTSNNLANPISALANKIRSHALSTFDKYLENKDHNSLAGAMVLGFRNTIDPKLYESYTKTGAVHVLAVSGLHVGILCQLLLLFLNKLFKSSNRDKLIKISILIFCTSVYIVITGGSPAVLRASVMIIIYFIGKYWASRVNSYNVISMAAFLLIMYDPYMIFQASFQFSFLALLSILYFYNPIYEWLMHYYEVNSSIVNYIWQMIALSFAAQILVAPLTIFYFHKFPLYFWLSGIVAIPAAYCVLILGIMMILSEYIAPSINTIIDPLLTFVFEIFIYCIQAIEHFPFAIIDNLWVYTHELLILYLAMLLFIAGRYVLNANYILASLITLMIFSFSRFQYSQETLNQAQITFYDNYRGHIIDIYDGQNCYTFHNQNLADRTVEYITSNNRMNRKSKHIIDLNLKSSYTGKNIIRSENLIQFKNESILLLDSNYVDHNKPIHVNTAIIIGKMKSKMDSIKSKIVADKWIITQSEKPYHQKLWREWCYKNNLNHISINEYGSYTYDLLE